MRSVRRFLRKAHRSENPTSLLVVDFRNSVKGPMGIEARGDLDRPSRLPLWLHQLENCGHLRTVQGRAVKSMRRLKEGAHSTC